MVVRAFSAPKGVDTKADKSERAALSDHSISSPIASNPIAADCSGYACRVLKALGKVGSACAEKG